MFKYVLKRILYIVPLMIGVTLLSFILIHSASKDVIDALYENTGGYASETVRAQARVALGLDRPLHMQYLSWFKNFVQGDMGISFVSGQPVFNEIVSRLPATFFLAGTAIFITVAVSLPLGIISAVKKQTPFDYVIRLITLTGNSMPGYLVSLLLIYLFSIRLQWFSVISGSGISGVILPALALSFAMISRYTRQFRALLLEEMAKEYVMGLKARGVRAWKIIMISVLKAVLPAMVTLLGLSLGSLLGGIAIIERIFMWEGVGKLAIDAILMRDYPIILAYVVWMAFIYAVINLFTDLLYQYLDPRIKAENEVVK